MTAGLAQGSVQARVPPGSGLSSADERDLLAALWRGDESAFATLVDALGPSMLRVASLYVATRAVAEEVVQDTWLAAFRSLNGFEGRSSRRTWLFVILTNAAKKRAARERRSVPFSELAQAAAEPDPDAERFFGHDHPRWAGCWTTIVPSWDELPEEQLLSPEAVAAAQTAAQALPPAQRTVFLLRDVEGWSAEEVCNVLELSDSNQRVLLHRARVNVRRALEQYFDREERRT